MQIEGPTMQQNLFQEFLSQEAGTSGNNRKGTTKALPKIAKNIHIKYLQIIFSLPAIQCKW